MCPQAAPFWNGSACVSCFQPRYFDFSLLKCSDCGSGNYYSLAESTCKPTNCVHSTYTFDPISGICRCPLDKPYEIGNLCSVCPPDQIFNAFRKMCIACPPGSTINELTLNCQCNDPIRRYSSVSNRC